MFDLIAGVVAWFYSLWPSYGMAIIFLTLAAMVVVTPLTMKGTRSMLQMQLLAPELKKIQNRHRGDRQAMNEASMAFYKEHGMNPVGGCLPLIAQMPIFLVLYRVVLGLTRRTTEIGTQLGFTSYQFSATQTGNTRLYTDTPISRSELRFDPDFLSTDTQLYADLNQNTEMVSWGVDLSRTASAAMAEGVITALPYFLMMGLVLVTGLYQQRQIQGRQGNTVMHPTQQTIMKLFPYFLPVFCYGMPAAVVVYFIASALYRIGQQAYITRSFYSGDDSLGAQVAEQRKSSGKSDSSDRTSRKAGKGGSSKAMTPRKGSPTPKRDAQASKGKARQPRSRAKKGKPSAPKRASRPGAPRRSASGAGRSGKAPSRRHPQGGRTTPRGTTGRRPAPNRSKSKKKRR